nr:cutinase gene palindrome-binding protein [Quercus suber]
MSQCLAVSGDIDLSHDVRSDVGRTDIHIGRRERLDHDHDHRDCSGQLQFAADRCPCERAVSPFGRTFLATSMYSGQSGGRAVGADPGSRSRYGHDAATSGYGAGNGMNPAMGGLSDFSMAGLDGDAAAAFMTDLDIDMALSMDIDDAAYQQQPQSQRQQTMQEQTVAQSALRQSQAEGHTSSTYDENFPHSVTAENEVSSPLLPDANINVAGAGPLPTGFGMPAPNGSSTLTEFTKRRNWSQRIIEELKDFLHILTPDGRILYVSPSCQSITGYNSRAITGKFIGDFVHPDDSGVFMREFNESIASGNPLRFFYRFKKEDGTYVIFECDGHPHLATEPGQNFDDNQGQQGQGFNSQCKGLFMMARPYPTKNAALLDSFLEHKIENERLMKRIADLKREEAEESAEQDKLYKEHANASAMSTGTRTESPAVLPRATNERQGNTPPPPNNYQGMPPPEKPSVSNAALTRQNLDSVLSSQRPDSIADKMSRYEANNTHLESIELLTGLRYRDGERSHGISTGDVSPALIRGDAGIAILLDRDRDGNKKEKKKLKVADEYVCADCGTLDSPEWRKGPKGPKTLCNACGLRWAKKEKKRGDDGKPDSPSGMALSGETAGSGSITSGMMPPGLTAQNSTGSS